MEAKDIRTTPVTDRIFTKEDLENARRAGIKEVVEFINSLIIGIEGCKFEERLDGNKGCILLDMNESQWQAKLKEWGINY